METDYRALNSCLKGLLADKSDLLAGLANASALLYSTLEQVNWAGFYLFKDGRLALGPFQGKVACTSIELGKGVCGTAALAHKTLVVEDVQKFPGHIACDGASRSEIVLPLLAAGRLLGVLDIDSPVRGRFTKSDAHGLEQYVAILVDTLAWPAVFI